MLKQAIIIFKFFGIDIVNIDFDIVSVEELKEYETELSKYDVKGSIKDFTNPIKIGDGTRTIGSCIQQFFQQVV